MNRVDKMIPHSKESEKSIVGSIFHTPETIHEAMSLINPEDIMNNDIRETYQVMLRLHHKSKPIDVLTVAEEYKNLNKFQAYTMDHLSVLEDYMPTAAQVAHHCRKVKALSNQRKFIYEMDKIVDKAYQISDDPTVVLDDAHSLVFDLMKEADKNSKDTEVYTPAEMAERGYKKAKEAFEDPAGMSGYQTGFPELDRHIKRLKDVNVIAASTGVGKTGLAVNVAVNLAVEKVPVLYINLEMDIDEIITRVLSILSGVDMDKIDTGNYGDNIDDFKLVGRFAEKLENSTLYMTGNKPKSISQITSLIHKYQSKYGIKVVIVDYIGHITSDKLAYKENNRRISLGRYNQALKQVCTTLGIKLVVVAQMNREGDKEAELSNVGECWQLAQDADIFMILHFEMVKNTDPEPDAPKEFKQYMISLKKNRNGPAPRTIPINYNERTQLMTDRGSI